MLSLQQFAQTFNYSFTGGGVTPGDAQNLIINSSQDLQILYIGLFLIGVAVFILLIAVCVAILNINSCIKKILTIMEYKDGETTISSES